MAAKKKAAPRPRVRAVRPKTDAPPAIAPSPAPAEPEEDKGPGQPPHDPTAATRQQVEMLAAYRINQDHIAALLGISDVTLRKHYRAELDLGTSKVIAQVANSLVKKALSDRPDAVNAAKFYLQAQAGWSEKTVVDVKGKVEVERPDLSGMTDAQLDALEALGRAMAGDAGGATRH